MTESIGERAVEIAQQKATEVKAKRPKPPALPKVDEQQREQAFAVALKLRDMRRAKLDELNQKTAAPNLGFIECRECLGPALWIHGDPEGWVRHTEWETAYKPKGADWGGKIPHCQCCAGEGRKIDAPVLHDGGQNFGIVIMKNYYREISREEFEQLTSGS